MVTFFENINESTSHNYSLSKQNRSHISDSLPFIHYALLDEEPFHLETLISQQELNASAVPKAFVFFKPHGTSLGKIFMGLAKCILKN